MHYRLYLLIDQLGQISLRRILNIQRQRISIFRVNPSQFVTICSIKSSVKVYAIQWIYNKKISLF